MSEQSDPKTVGGSTNIEQHVDDVPVVETDSTMNEAGSEDKPSSKGKLGDAAMSNEQRLNLTLDAVRRDAIGANLFNDSELARHVGKKLPGVSTLPRTAISNCR